jgi:hypothetical protein
MWWQRWTDSLEADGSIRGAWKCGICPELHGIARDLSRVTWNLLGMDGTCWEWMELVQSYFVSGACKL